MIAQCEPCGLSQDECICTVDACDCPVPSAGPGDEPWTELGCARRLADRFGDRLRHVGAWKKWLVWDGTRWAPNSDGQPARWAKVIARGLTTEAMAIQDKDERKAKLAQARRLESSAAIAGILTLAATEARIAITPDRLDADPFLVNCANGTIDLRTMTLQEHDSADLLTKIAGAAYDPQAQGPAWDKFLSRVQPEEPMREYLARLVGHTLEGRVVEHLLAILFGAGANGKSTFEGAVSAALGDYAAPADPELLTARTFDAHPTGTADLFGLRLAVLHETDKGRRLAEGTVKRLTGGDRIKARRMREDFWSFDPSHTFVMLTNHKPLVSGQDEGIWRRIKLVPWDVVIPLEERDLHLDDQLALELDAVLAWLVRGYAAWRANGLDDPAQVIAATDAYKAESDVIGRFLDECCLIGLHFHVRSAELFSAWCRWCGSEGEEAGTQTAFSTMLTNRGFDKRRGAGGYIWRGLGLQDGGE